MRPVRTQRNGTPHISSTWLWEEAMNHSWWPSAINADKKTEEGAFAAELLIWRQYVDFAKKRVSPLNLCVLIKSSTCWKNAHCNQDAEKYLLVQESQGSNLVCIRGGERVKDSTHAHSQRKHGASEKKNRVLWTEANATKRAWCCSRFSGRRCWKLTTSPEGPDDEQEWAVSDAELLAVVVPAAIGGAQWCDDDVHHRQHECKKF